MLEPGGFLHGPRGRGPHRAIPAHLQRGPATLEPPLPHPRRGRSTPCSTSPGAIITARPTGTRGCRITLVRRTGAGQIWVRTQDRSLVHRETHTHTGPGGHPVGRIMSRSDSGLGCLGYGAMMLILLGFITKDGGFLSV